MVCVFCEERGLGVIQEVLQEQFWHHFQRLQAGGFAGTGIGLAICKVVERHGGDVWVESQLGRGSTFQKRGKVKYIIKPPPEEVIPLEVLLVEDGPGDVRLTQKRSTTPTRRSICKWPSTGW